VQEARYQFSRYIKIGKALTFGTAESHKPDRQEYPRNRADAELLKKELDSSGFGS